jgi:hypothetical protein
LQVVTRPPHQQGTAEKAEIENILNRLQKVGVQIIQRRSMHQKVVVIDGRIAWFGSDLPPLNGPLFKLVLPAIGDAPILEAPHAIAVDSKGDLLKETPDSPQ